MGRANAGRRGGGRRSAEYAPHTPAARGCDAFRRRNLKISSVGPPRPPDVMRSQRCGGADEVACLRLAASAERRRHGERRAFRDESFCVTQHAYSLQRLKACHPELSGDRTPSADRPVRPRQRREVDRQRRTRPAPAPVRSVVVASAGPRPRNRLLAQPPADGVEV